MSLRTVPFLLSLLVLSAFCSCAFLNGLMYPKGYVPDEKVVYLKQKIEFDPIRYSEAETTPYEWKVPAQIASADPAFLRASSLDPFLEADYAADAKTYTDVAAFFSSIQNNPAYKELKARCQTASIEIPKPLPAEKGEQLKQFTNAIQYVYPKEDKASITIFSGGDYFITFADGSKFTLNRNGNYFFEESDKSLRYQVHPSENYSKFRTGGETWEFTNEYKRLETAKGSYTIRSKGEIQDSFSIAPYNDDIVIFFDDKGAIKEYALIKKNGFRIDYFPVKKDVLFVQGNRSVSIFSDYQKIHGYFDERTRKARGMISLYYPEGIKLTGLDTEPSYSQIQPAWPERYLRKKIGPFVFLYAAADEQKLSLISGEKLTAVESFCRKETGLSVASERTIIIPPNLESYRKLHTNKQKETMYWYPSGFQTKDIIIMWPISVPRYSNPAGQDYFFSTEFYEILTHEFVHLMVGESSGIIAPVPVWLNEGLAVLTESRYSEDTRAYWEVTFQVSKRQGRLLSWDDVTTKTTGEFPVDKARIHYAQSYAMIKYLVNTYGASRVASYVRSFKTDSEKLQELKLENEYKTNFQRVFGTSWETALAAAGMTE